MSEKREFNGNYRGLVINNKDPKGARRCKIAVFGVYDDISEEFLPWAEYADPFMIGTPDAGGSFVPPIGSKVWVFFEAGDHMQPVYFAGAPSHVDGPKNVGGEYPFNRVFKSPAGHIIEIDDTPDNTRIRVLHASGSQIEFYENGDVIETVVGNHRRIVTGNSTEIVNGNLSTVANGDIKNISAGGTLVASTSKINISGTTIDLNSGGLAAIQQPAEGFSPPADVQMSPRNASVIIEALSSRAAFDEPEEEIPEGWPEPTSKEEVVEPTEIDEEDAEVEELSEECDVFTTVDYNLQLSPSFKLRDLSIGAVFPHTIRAQGGLTEQEIVCNLKHLCINILEPLKAQFPDIRINSGFRNGSGTSQHNKGMAVDIQVPGAPASLYTEIARWVVANVPYDQFILEHGNSVWLHISYNRTLSTQRKARLTYYPRATPNYQAGLTNYYHNGGTEV